MRKLKIIEHISLDGVIQHSADLFGAVGIDGVRIDDGGSGLARAQESLTRIHVVEFDVQEFERDDATVVAVHGLVVRVHSAAADSLEHWALIR